MKKVFIFISLLVTILFTNSISTYSSESWTKEDYLNEISNLEEEINEIKSQIDSIKSSLQEKNEIYNELKERADNIIDDENLLKWFNTCDKFTTRSNVTIIDEVNKNFGMTRELIYSSGFVFMSNNDNYYVLTISNPFPKRQAFVTQNFYVEDCFGYQYNASQLVNDTESNLMIIGFTSEYDDANIYTLDIADSALKEDDLICHIFSNQNTLKNHMDFTTIDNVLENEYKTTISIECTNYGYMGVGFDNKVHSISFMSDNSQIISYNEKYIKDFLVANNYL